MPPETFPIALLALLLDAAFGYPDWVFRKAGHPVTWIGALIGFADRRLNKESSSRLARKLAGVLAIVCVIAAASATGLLIQIAAGTLPYGWALTAIAASTLFASRSLYTHVRDVAEALESGGLEGGGAPSRASSGAIPTRSIAVACAAPPSKAWAKTPRTAWPRRFSGSFFWGCRASPPTKPSTPPTA